ncbi:hypothetical protein ES705_30829 [subsurface metagenome]
MIALMLTWANDRENFRDFPSIDTLLENKTKDELISIIKEMLERVPELIENRIEMLKVLFEIKKWDITQGGYGIGDNIPEILSTDTTPKERKIIVDLIDSAIKEGVSGWGRIAWGDFLLSIFETDSDTEGFLKKTGL